MDKERILSTVEIIKLHEKDMEYLTQKLHSNTKNAEG